LSFEANFPIAVWFRSTKSHQQILGSISSLAGERRDVKSVNSSSLIFSQEKVNFLDEIVASAVLTLPMSDVFFMAFFAFQ
jgi:hypothetical protein